MNLNHLVNFTVIEKPIFYDLCDRMGILLVTEFPFRQFGPMHPLDPSYPRREAFVKSALKQVEEIVVALRNHPPSSSGRPSRRRMPKTPEAGAAVRYLLPATTIRVSPMRWGNW